MSPIGILATLTTVLVLANAKDPKSCVFNAINEVQVVVESEDNPALTFLFEELAIRTQNACENDTQVVKCTQKKLAAEKEYYETLILFYDIAMQKIVKCYNVSNEVECTDAVYDALKPIMKELNLGKDVEDELAMFQSICHDYNKKSHPKNKIKKSKFSYAKCNYEAFENNIFVMECALPYIDQLSAQVAKC